MKARFLHIDKLKGFAIFLVVFGHLIQRYTYDSISNPCFEIIYSFHMPLFFFLSGFIANKTTLIADISSYVTFLKKKTITLLLPFFTWSILVRFAFRQYNYSLDSAKQLLIEQITHPSLWFLLTLYEIMLIFSIFNFLSTKYNNKNKSLFDLILFTIVFLPFSIFSLLNFEYVYFTIHLAFFFFGVFISRYTYFEKFILNTWVFLISLCCFIVFVTHYHSEAPPTFTLKILKTLLNIFLAIWASILFYNLSLKLKLLSFINQFLVTMGQITIVIYVLPIILFPHNLILPKEFPLFFTILLSAIFSVIQMYICFGINKIVKLIPPLEFLLFGKPMKHEH